MKECLNEFAQSGLALYCLAAPGIFDTVIQEIAEDYGTAINPRLLASYSENLLKGVRGVMDGQYGSRYFGLQNRLEANVARFAAYKAYHATEQVKRQLTGTIDRAEGLKRAKGVLSAFNRYQAAEYATAISRCRSARQWVDFTEPVSLDLFPNLRWLESRSAEQRPEHQKYYNRVWAKVDPFWRQNQPGNLWRCKCDWEETSDPVDNEGVVPTPPPVALAGNPAETGEVFTDRAVYFTANNHERVGGAILESGPGGYYAKGNIPGVQTRAHVLHHPGEVAGNMDVASVFCAQNPGVKSLDLLPNVVRENEAMRPKFYPKGMLPRGANNNADAVLEWADGGKWVVDFKCMQGNGGKLLDRLNDAYKQADYSVIKVMGEIKDLERLIKDATKFIKGHNQFRGIVIYDRLDNEIYRLTR